MNYLDFKNEYLRLCEKFERNTNRKIKNDLKNDAKELQYRIDAIEPQIKRKCFGYLYGELHKRITLNRIKTELKFTNQLLTEIQ